MPRRFDKPAVARLRAAFGEDVAVELRRPVAPYGDIAAVACCFGIGQDERIGIDIGVKRRRRFSYAVEVAADSDGAAADVAGRASMNAPEIMPTLSASTEIFPPVCPAP